jgi:1,2-dihydroxy-3-keto-5-methylthiopentene dioxygenase
MAVDSSPGSLLLRKEVAPKGTTQQSPPEAHESSPVLSSHGSCKYSSVPIEAWYFNANDEEPPCSPHQYNPNRKVPIEHLNELGVLTWTQIETEEYETNEFLNNVKKDRGYNYEEVLTVAPGKIPNFEANTKKFYTEHLHEHEEIRFILDGVGYEDVRDFDGQWIRIEIKKGDLIVLPPGMYHRFTLDSAQYLKALLLYQDQPCRIQFDSNPETDIMEVRQEYLQSVLEKEEFYKAESRLGCSLDLATNSLEALTV